MLGGDVSICMQRMIPLNFGEVALSLNVTTMTKKAVSGRSYGIIPLLLRVRYTSASQSEVMGLYLCFSRVRLWDYTSASQE